MIECATQAVDWLEQSRSIGCLEKARKMSKRKDLETDFLSDVFPLFVFLDTNVFYKAGFVFENNSLENIRKYCENGAVHLLSNDIVEREAKAHVSRDLQQDAFAVWDKLKGNKALFYAMSEEEKNKLKEDITNTPQAVFEALDMFLSLCEMIPYDDLTIDALFSDYFNQIPPFEKREKKKSEFPDAVIAHSIKRRVRDYPDNRIYVVTDDDGLIEALKCTPSVIVMSDLKSFLNYVSSQKDSYKNIIQFLADSGERIADIAKTWLEDQDWADAIREIDASIECDEIQFIDVKGVSLKTDAVEYVDAVEAVASVVMSGFSEIELDFTYVDHTFETYDKEDEVYYGTKWGVGECLIKAPIEMELSVFIPMTDDDEFDFIVEEYDEFDLRLVDILDSDLDGTAGKIHGTYYNRCPECGELISRHNDGGNGFCTSCAGDH